MLLILCQLTEEPESSSSGTPEMHPAPHQSAGGIVCGTDAGGWVGATISWAAAGFPSEPQSSTATVAYGMCILPPSSRHAGSWERRGGDVAVTAFRPRAWVVCAGRGCSGR